MQIGDLVRHKSGIGSLGIGIVIEHDGVFTKVAWQSYSYPLAEVAMMLEVIG